MSQHQPNDHDDSPYHESRIQRIGRYAVGVSALVFTGLIAYPFVEHVWTRPSRHEAKHEVDHAAILAAARAMMDTVSQTGFGFASNPENPINDPRVPAALQKVNPQWIMVHPDWVQIEFFGGFEHYGFFAYRTDVEKQSSGVKLIDGLYYYSE